MSDVLEEIKREISARIEELRPLVAEAAQLEDAIGALNRSQPAPSTKRSGRGRAKDDSSRGRRRRSAPRGQTRGLILKHLGDNPGSTAGDIAKALGLNRNSVATRLAQMAKAGEIAKANRGYAVAG